MPRVSAVVVTYNSERFIKGCLRSLFAQTGCDLDVIVVDNGSADRTVELVRRGFPKARVIQTGSNLGYAVANNIGIWNAKGDYVLILNPDADLEADCVRRLVEAIREPGVGLVAPKILLKDSPGRVNACGNDIHITGYGICRGLGQSAESHDESVEIGAVSGAAFMARRDLLKRLGGFDGKFFMYLEDTDLSLRARMLGYRISYVPEAVAYHEYTFRLPEWKFYHLEKNRLALLVKNFGSRILLGLSPSLLLMEGMTWLYALGRGRKYTGAKIRSYFWLAQNISCLRWCKTEQRVSDKYVLRKMTTRLQPEDFLGHSRGRVGRVLKAVAESLFAINHRLVA